MARSSARAARRSAGAGEARERRSKVPFAVETHWRWLLAWILLLAAAVRVAAVFALDRSLYGDFLLWDERTYDAWARSILAGAPLDVQDQSALPAYAVAAAYRLLGPQYLSARLLNAALGVGLCYLIWRLGRSLGGISAGLLAALLAALYKPFLFVSATLLKESLVLALFALLIWLFVAELDEPRAGRALWLGAVASLLLDVRQNALPAIALVFFLAARRALRTPGRWRAGAKSAAALGLGLLMGSAPLALQRQAATGQLTAVPVSGFNLYLGNYLPSGTPYYRPVPFATSNAMEQGVHFVVEASRRAGRRLTAAEASRYWQGEVLAEARRAPLAFAGRLAQKALAVFNRFEEGDNHDIDFVSRFAPFFSLPFLAFWFVMPLGMAGLVVALGRDRRAGALALVGAAYAVTMVIAFSNMRIRLPLLVLFIPLAAVGLLRLRWRERRPALLFGAVALIFAGVELWPLPGAGDVTAHLNTHALNLADRGRLDESLAYWNASAAMHGSYSDFANLALAQDALYRRGDPVAALKQVEEIGERSYAAAAKQSLVGDALQALGRADEALAAYRSSLAINSADRLTRRRLIDLLRQRDPGAADREEETLRYVESFYATVVR